MSIIYRKAVIADCAVLTQIRMDNMDMYMEHESADAKRALCRSIQHYFEKGITENTLITWLACDAGKIISTSGLTFFDVMPSITNMSGRQGYITNMYTYPEYRCRGIASKLLELTIEEAKLQGCGRLVLYKTEMAENIYINFGFENSSGYMTYCP